MTRDTGDELALQAGPAMFRLGRLIPRTVSQVVSEHTDQAVTIQHALVADAIDAELAAGHPASVGSVAARTGVDPSTGSRLVSAAIRAGNVERVASQHDGRRVHLRLTEKGRALLAASRRYQQDVFDNLTQDWPATDKQELARLVIRLADEAAARQAGGR